MTMPSSGSPLKASEAVDILGRYGKSFRFASLLMPRRDAEDAARLYSACRVLDDLADESSPSARPAARQRLDHIRTELKGNHTISDPISRILVDLQQRRQLDLKATDYLIETMRADADGAVQIDDEAALFAYCYGAAGSVGVMMSPLVGAPQSSLPFAVDLGLAMQMTNIARDVLEDAAAGRRYLPASWVEGLSAEDIDAGSQDAAIQARVATAIKHLLHLAEQYYHSAGAGIATIPGRNGWAIKVAALVYREIGQVLARQHYTWWQGRAQVSLGGKFACLWHQRGHHSPFARAGHAHDPSLHWALEGFPGCSGSSA